MKTLRLIARGFLQLNQLEINTVKIAHGHVLGSFAVSFWISLVWWGNAGASGRSREWSDGPWYALGAACGTVTGLQFTRWLYA